MNRWLLVLPGILVLYSLGGLTAGELGIGNWILLLVGVSPFLWGWRSSFKGTVWDVVTRAAALVTILVFLWNNVPLLRTVVTGLRNLIDRLAQTGSAP
jgi:hypothetical protein